MSYLSRLYNHRNAQAPEVKNEKPFFSNKSDDKKSAKNTFFQAKLAVNKPGDNYEKEADAVANAVVNKSSQKQIAQQNNISSVQRLATAPEEEKVSSNDQRMERDKEKPFQLQRKSAGEEKLKEDESNKKSTPVQAKHESNSSSASSQVSSKIESSAGKGKKLPAKTLHEMNASFGTDFSNVHIHNDSESAEMNKELQAHAFTHGNDIYFNSGKYSPENSDGKFLLAHELTHVVQQQPENIVRRQKKSRIEPYIKRIKVFLTPKQHAEIEWQGTPPSDAAGSDHFTVSTGKGYSDPGDEPGTCKRDCCEDATTQCAAPFNKPSSKGACCTYVGTDFYTGTAVPENNGWHWWTPVQPYYSTRQIALHQHSEVTGDPIGHGCVRMDENNAKRIYDFSVIGKTKVDIEGEASPVKCEDDQKCKHEEKIKSSEQKKEKSAPKEKAKDETTGK